MLQMIPRVSEDKARNLAKTPQFSSLRKVFEAYRREGLVGKDQEQLLQHAFNKPSSAGGKGGHKEISLSKTVLKLMTCEDPSASL
jgi:hypothetical protein